MPDYIDSLIDPMAEASWVWNRTWLHSDVTEQNMWGYALEFWSVLLLMNEVNWGNISQERDKQTH